MKKTICVIILTSISLLLAANAQESVRKFVFPANRLASGGGDAGGIGYKPAIFLTSDQAQALQILQSNEEIIALGGGGDAGGIGKTVDFMIINGRIVNIQSLQVQSQIQNRVVLRANAELVDDIELKAGEYISGRDIQAIAGQMRMANSLIAIAAKDVQNVFMANGQVIESAELVAPLAITESQAIDSMTKAQEHDFRVWQADNHYR